MSWRGFLIAWSLVVFFVLLSLFFVDRPWVSELHEVPVAGPGGIADTLFTSYAVTIILIAVLLASAMIGGVYLAKVEDGR